MDKNHYFTASFIVTKPDGSMSFGDVTFPSGSRNISMKSFNNLKARIAKDSDSAPERVSFIAISYLGEMTEKEFYG